MRTPPELDCLPRGTKVARRLTDTLWPLILLAVTLTIAVVRELLIWRIL